MKAKQLQFFDKISLEHGGALNKNKRKNIRPLTTKKPIHVTLRSSKARGVYSLLNFNRKIEKVISKSAAKFAVTVYKKANSGNHLHLQIRGKKRDGIQNFFRSISSQIARLITGAKKGKPFGKFWDNLIYTRVLSSWAKEFRVLGEYIEQNTLETLGLIKYRPRKVRANSS